VSRIGSLERRLILETLRRHETLRPEQANVLLARTVQVIRQRIGYSEVSADEQLSFLLALLRATQ
jgi:hypothetical protein